MNDERRREIQAAGLLTEEEFAALETGEGLREPERPRHALAGLVVSWMGFAAAAWLVASSAFHSDRGSPDIFDALPLLFLPVAALLLRAGAPSRGPARRLGWKPAGLALRGRAIAGAALALVGLAVARWAA
ncbi:MAG: hypothetical protein MUC63_02445 [Planctomycetes bacterium]|jgi:hypothetical protein|nr:hypothetical protein [Planctomycetota bacterium]